MQVRPRKRKKRAVNLYIEVFSHCAILLCFNVPTSVSPYIIIKSIGMLTLTNYSCCVLFRCRRSEFLKGRSRAQHCLYKI